MSQLRMVGVGGLGLMLGPSARHLAGDDSPAKFIRMHDRGTRDERRKALRQDWRDHGAQLVADNDDSYDVLIGDGDFDVIVVCAGKNGDDLEIFRQLTPIVRTKCGHSMPIILHLSTVSVDFVFAAKKHWDRIGAHYVNYPLTGGQKGANEATMLILASGRGKIYEYLLPTLRKIGNPHYFDHRPESGAVFKLLNHYNVFGGLWGVSSAVSLHADLFCEGKMGSHQTATFDALEAGASYTKQWPVALRKGIADGVWDSGFMVKHAVVDMIYLADLALKSGQSYYSNVLPLICIAAQLSYLLNTYDEPLATHAIAREMLAARSQELDRFVGAVINKNPDFSLPLLIASLPEKVRETVCLDIAADSFK